MPAITMRSMFKTPKKRGRPATKKARMCAPKVPYNTCMSASKNTKCQWVHGKKREYCRTLKNKKA